MDGNSERAAAPAAAAGSGTAFALLAALGFASVSTLTSLATGAGVALAVVLLWRYAIGAAVLGLYAGTARHHRLPRREEVRWIVLGGGGQALLVGMALWSLRWLSVAQLAFLFYTYPAWVALFQTIRGEERPTRRRLAALALSFGGVAVINGAPLGGGPGAALAPPGVALALGAAVVYGLYIPLMQWMQRTHPVTVTSAYAQLGSAACFLLLALGRHTLGAGVPASAWAAIAALALFGTVLPSAFFLMGLMRLGPVRTAIVSTVEPFLTAVIGLIVLHQAASPGLLLGGTMIVGAVLLLQARAAGAD